jgi:Ras family.
MCENIIYFVTLFLELQRNVMEPLVMSVVGNKTDLESERKVPRQEALQYATAIGASYFESSALHDEGNFFTKTVYRE